MNLVLKYSFFAVVAITANILFQYVSFALYSGAFGLYIAMFWGTLAGLVIKYTLDKRYIFYHITKNKIDDGKKFVLYSTTGAFTTMIFWGSELGFNALFQSNYSKYIGAILGLSIGYVTKYFLDKKYVFIR
jgi:putative flippase GtrA